MVSRSTRNEPWLIQRIFRRRVPERGRGIDSYFMFDYMGSAEFEFGKLPETLRAMRAQEAVYPNEPTRIKDQNGRIVWYVGPDDETVLAYVRGFFEDQSYSSNRRISLKEPTQMRLAYEPAARTYDGEPVPVGWWAIDVKLPWLLFVKKADAKEWIKRMKG